MKVEDLEKASESANHENGLLRAQVSRLQEEIKDYRRRLSTSSRTGSQVPFNVPADLNSRPKAVDFNGFQFDFPEFGGPPGSQIFGNASSAKTDEARKPVSPAVSAAVQSRAPGSLQRPSLSQVPVTGTVATGIVKSDPASYTIATTRPGANGTNAGLAGMFGASVLASTARPAAPAASAASASEYSQLSTLNRDVNGDPSKSAQGPRVVAPYNNGGLSASASPSASSISHHAAGSSNCTSPGSYVNSPANIKALDMPASTGQGETMFQALEGETTRTSALAIWGFG